MTIAFSIGKKHLNLVRQLSQDFDTKKGSVVLLRTSGMGIGDSFLELVKGDPSLPVVQDGQAMPFVIPTDKLDETMASVKKLVDALNDDRHTMGKLLHDQGAYYEQIRRMLTNSADITQKMSAMLDLVTSKDGTVGAFLNDRKFYDNLVTLQDQSRKLMDGLIDITRNATEVSRQFSELAGKQNLLYTDVTAIMKKVQGLTDQFTIVAKNLADVSGALPELTEKGTQTMTSARDVMNALKSNFLIRPFIPQPSADRPLELVPRGSGE